MERAIVTNEIEAVLFAAAEPVAMRDLKKIFNRRWADQPDEAREALMGELGDAFKDLQARWQDDDNQRGFQLVQVAEGFTFRSNSRYADTLRAMREQRPVRLSRAALECLAVVAYRQPVTKPDVDHIRGVDCGGTLRMLLERNLVRIVGKKDEPGRPLLYGTTKEFLSFFNLGNLAQLPTLREFSELTEESQEELSEFERTSLQDLSASAQQLRLDEEPAVQELDAAVAGLKQTETQTQQALEAEGIKFADDPNDPVKPPSQPEAEPGPAEPEKTPDA